MSKDVHILVVDDFATMRRIVRNLLHELGYDNVSEADDGATALPILQQGNVDVLITDWHMPIMSGMALLKAVRADFRLRRLPVLMLTAEGGPEQLEEATRAGANGYVTKPFTAFTLKQKLKAVLDPVSR